MQPANSYHPRSFSCSYPGCGKSCHTRGGLKQHLGLQPEDDDDQNSNFSEPDEEPGRRQVRYHPILNGKLSFLLLFLPADNSVFWVLPVIIKGITLLQTRPHHLGTTHHYMTGHRSNPGHNLNLQISYTAKHNYLQVKLMD